MNSSKYRQYVQEKRLGLLRAFPRLRFGGSFRGRSYDHILAEKGDVTKLLVDEQLQSVDVCKNLFGGKLKFQSCAHHVNSSQIMCMNYFGPLLLSHGDVLSALLRMVGIDLKGRILSPGSECNGSQFEYKPQVCGDRTNFDLYLLTDIGEEVFIEAKYTESEFGKPSSGSLKDDEWEFYRHLCERSLNLRGVSRNEFYSNFQVNRNIAHVANDKQYCLFFIPRSNPALKIPQLAGLKNIVVLYVEDVLGFIEKGACPTSLKKYYRKLHEMYCCSQA